MPVERANTESIQQQMVRDNRDLVRYSPDVGVADQGRHQKGFAIRGVEDNRKPPPQSYQSQSSRRQGSRLVSELGSWPQYGSDSSSSYQQ